MRLSRTVHRGRWTPADRAEAVFRYLPVEVPADARGVEIHLDYPRVRGVLDLGLFGPDDFRGYSGGERHRVIVTPSGATPGYLPGEIPPGTWRVFLGLHAIPVGGLEYELTVRTDPDPPPPPPPRPARSHRPERRELPAQAGRRWVAGDLHSHSTHSDGALSLAGLADQARGAGLDYLAVSDHNTTSHHPHLPELSAWSGVALVAGQEVTRDGGHANCFGDVGWVDFRQPPDAWLAHARREGGVLSINHPLETDLAWRLPLGDPPDLVEVWHTSWDRRSSAPVTWCQRRGGAPIGGSDFHRPGERPVLGRPTTWVAVDGDGDVEASSIIEALQQGRVTITWERDGPAIVPFEDARLVAVGATGTRLLRPDGRREPVPSDRWETSAEPGIHRLLGPDDLTVAMTLVGARSG